MEQYQAFFGNWFGQLVERVIRLHQYLSERAASERAASAPDRIKTRASIVNHVQDSLEDLARDLLTKATHFVNNPTVEKHLAVYYAIGRTAASQYRHLHSVVTHIPAPWPSPELELFLRNVLEEGGFHEPISCTILLSGDYNFSHILDPTPPSKMLPSRHALLSVPSAEQDNPLMWPNLLHEIGHEIGQQHGVVKAAEALLLKGDRRQQSASRLKEWTHEIVADLLAADYLGPAFIGAFVNFATYWYPRSLREPSFSHPDSNSRVTYLYRHLKSESRGSFDDVLTTLKADFNVRIGLDQNDITVRNNLYQTLGNARAPDSEFPTREELDEFVDEIATLAEYKAIKPKPFDETDASHVKRLATRLAKGELIASYRDSKILINYPSEKDVQLDKFRAARNQLWERPNSVRHILNAALVRRLSDVGAAGENSNANIGFHGSLLRDFCGSQDAMRKRLIDLRPSVNRLDAVISKSMEGASVMAFYQEHKQRPKIPPDDANFEAANK